jgi:hypothetical protein
VAFVDGNRPSRHCKVMNLAGCPPNPPFSEGRMLKFHELTPHQYLAREADRQGVCLRCGAWSNGTDPGVAKGSCGICGAMALHGIEQALLLGEVQIRR